MTFWLAIRAIIYYIILFITSLIWFSAILLTRPFSKTAVYCIIASWSRQAAWWCKVICGLSYEIEGAENFNKVPAIFFVKHQSAWETFTLAGILPCSVFVVKRSLLMIPFVGWGMAFAKYIAINRKAGHSAFKYVLNQGAEHLKQGHSIVIFPEGTRVAPKTYPEFHKSGAALAKATGYPVIPIAHNAGSFWKRRAFIKKPGTIKMIVGEPIPTKNGVSTEQLRNMTHSWMQKQMKKIEQ